MPLLRKTFQPRIPRKDSLGHAQRLCQQCEKHRLVPAEDCHARKEQRVGVECYSTYGGCR